MQNKFSRFACLVGVLVAVGLSGVGAQLRSRPAAKWIQNLERPERVEGLKIDYVTKDQVNGWMADAGFKPVQEIAGLPNDKWFIIYAWVKGASVR